jgi:phytoene/squalene synthetase
MTPTATLAKSITWAGSKQTYYTAKWMVDKDLVNDFFRAYAYFRWADDIIDVSAQTDEERLDFVRRQRDLIERLYSNASVNGLSPEEEIAAELIRNERGESGRLQSFIRNMFAIIEFDAQRKGRLISQEELNWYTESLGKSVTDGIQYFIGNDHRYPITEDRNLASHGAHISHLLRDMLPDTADGFINIPREYLDEYRIGPGDVESEPFREWVRVRVEKARDFFLEGKKYLDRLEVLRCKIVGHWYCARFEGVLDAIERDGYVLRKGYEDRRRFSSWLNIALLALSVSSKHIRR